MKKLRELISEEDYQRALEAGRAATDQPHAVRASYNARSRMLTIVYSNHFSCSLDVRHAPILQDYPNADYSEPMVTPGGDGLLFERANLSVDLPMVVAKFLPPSIGSYWAASRQGRKTSEAKASAARINGARGGRPRKTVSETKMRRTGSSTS